MADSIIECLAYVLGNDNEKRAFAHQRLEELSSQKGADSLWVWSIPIPLAID